MEEPDYELDWLLDIRLYSRSFRADRASMQLAELGLANQYLRQHIADRRKFFDNRERLQRLKTMVQPGDTGPDLDCKMIAVVAKADQPELFNIICTLYHSYAETGDGIDLDKSPASWEPTCRRSLSSHSMNPCRWRIKSWSSLPGTNGYADAVPVGRMKKWESDLIRNLTTSQSGLGKDIAEKKQITPQTEQKLRAALETFQTTWH